MPAFTIPDSPNTLKPFKPPIDFQLRNNVTDTKTSHNKRHPSTPTCTNKSCFFCTLTETDSSIRRFKIAKSFYEMPQRDDGEHVLALSGLWKIAMTKPNDPEFPSLGIFECMAQLIQRGVSDRGWFLTHQNIYIPYYAAHIIGSYTMNKAKFAEKAVKSGVVLPLLELLRGKISWVEQRVAVRALGHIASHPITFEAIAKHEEEIIENAIRIASTCLQEVYHKFLSLKESKRLKYHRNLLTRGIGGVEFENRKAEEWASQIQCWSLYILDCFARREKGLKMICKKEFLKDLCNMWGGLANPEYPSGLGLTRTLCHTKTGRQSIAELREVLDCLCYISRSSDKWQYKAIECLLFLLKNPDSRYQVIDTVAPALVDLVEMRSLKGKGKAGQGITQVLLQDYHKIKYCEMELKSKRAEKALGEVWDLKVERIKREKLMGEDEIKERQVLAGVLKQEGNERFWSGDVDKAVMKYSEALDLCPLKLRRERIVIHSNRAQCYLLLRDADSAISDTTRALCLSGAVKPHVKSLWRRSQAYDMKGMAKESLMDCLMFINGRIRSRERKGVRIPYYATRMINKQMNATWLFGSAKINWCSKCKHEQDEPTALLNMKGMPNNIEEHGRGGKVWKRRKSGRVRQTKKVASTKMVSLGHVNKEGDSF